ncbi:hypothetical protein ARMA_1862 [Ardenticatena maritima]|uniref:Cytochrome c domain-containing protein n=1 Tax=Ardenticatena maritima TaxID=872965 RepID=A0A0M8K9W7_9CHLR|nr:c-type cytochrome [Ardenticatena maritima]GAP63439.1 hypothetical protein ARMA_1862 [Ardenticatena maritima]
MRTKVRWLSVVLVLLALVLAACGGNTATAPDESEHDVSAAPAHDASEEHVADEAHAEAHGLPEEALQLENPIPATEESIARGREIYAQNCASCHGDEGYGDGPAAAGLDPKPANLHMGHVQMLPDGGLFWIISHGVEGTAMPAWENVLSEEDRWHVVNYIRTFDDMGMQNMHEEGGMGEMHEDGHMHEEGDSH